MVCGCSQMYYISVVISYFQKGTKAPGAAGKIHTDFEKGFIMAEVSKVPVSLTSLLLRNVKGLIIA